MEGIRMTNLEQRIYRELGRVMGTRLPLGAAARYFGVTEEEVDQALTGLEIQRLAVAKPSVFEPGEIAWYRSE
jgi:hypothetical protein